MRGFFGRGVYNGVETQPGGGEDVQEQEMIAQLLQQDERGMEALARGGVIAALLPCCCTMGR